jgi:hypothetical protein
MPRQRLRGQGEAHLPVANSRSRRYIGDKKIGSSTRFRLQWLRPCFLTSSPLARHSLTKVASRHCSTTHYTQPETRYTMCTNIAKGPGTPTVAHTHSRAHVRGPSMRLLPTPLLLLAAAATAAAVAAAVAAAAAAAVVVVVVVVPVAAVVVAVAAVVAATSAATAAAAAVSVTTTTTNTNTNTNAVVTVVAAAVAVASRVP